MKRSEGSNDGDERGLERRLAAVMAIGRDADCDVRYDMMYRVWVVMRGMCVYSYLQAKYQVPGTLL